MVMKRIQMIQKAKKIACLLLLIASLLPFAQCSSTKESVEWTNGEAKVVAQPYVGRTSYVWHDFRPSEGQSWAFALAFVWPIPVLLVKRKLDAKFVKPVLQLVEIPLCGLTSYVLWCYFYNPFLRILSAGYLAIVGTVIYITAILAEVPNWLKKRSSN